jgi:hypothetical protein
VEAGRAIFACFQPFLDHFRAEFAAVQGGKMPNTNSFLDWWGYAGLVDPVTAVQRHVKASPISQKHAEQPHETVAWVLLTPTIFAIIGYLKRSVNSSGAMAGWLVAFSCCCAGFEYFMTLLFFFVSSTVKTSPSNLFPPLPH